MIKLFRRNRSTSSITASLSSMAKQLRDHATAQTTQGCALQDEAAVIRERAAAVHDDARTASATAARIEELLGQ